MIALVRNADPERVPELVAALPESVRRDIEYLDLSRRDLRDLRADLLLIHGRDDPLIPATESLALAAAVPPGRADVFVVGNLSHVEIHPGGIPDTLAAVAGGLSAPCAARWAHGTRSGPVRARGCRRYDQRIRTTSAIRAGRRAGSAGGSNRGARISGADALTPTLSGLT